MFMRSRSKPLKRLLPPICLTLLLFTLAVFAIQASQRQMAAASLRLTRDSVSRAAVQCYALEGAYAADLQHLIDNYGIRPDTNNFVVHYLYLGDNLLPDITVLPYAGNPIL